MSGYSERLPQNLKFTAWPCAVINLIMRFFHNRVQESSLMGGIAGVCGKNVNVFLYRFPSNSPLPEKTLRNDSEMLIAGGCQPPFGWWGRWGNEAGSDPVGSPSCLEFVEDDGESNGIHPPSFVKANGMITFVGRYSIHAAFGIYDFYTVIFMFLLYSLLKPLFSRFALHLRIMKNLDHWPLRFRDFHGIFFPCRSGVGEELKVRCDARGGCPCWW